MPVSPETGPYQPVIQQPKVGLILGAGTQNVTATKRHPDKMHPYQTSLACVMCSYPI
jgi:hypothetical protein